MYDVCDRNTFEILSEMHDVMMRYGFVDRGAYKFRPRCLIGLRNLSNEEYLMSTSLLPCLSALSCFMESRGGGYRVTHLRSRVLRLVLSYWLDPLVIRRRSVTREEGTSLAEAMAEAMVGEFSYAEINPRDEREVANMLREAVKRSKREAAERSRARRERRRDRRPKGKCRVS